MSADDYKSKLTEAAYKVCRQGATEAPFSGEYNDHWLTGVYHCVCCHQPLFNSDAKFNAGCGWPSFNAAIENTIVYREDQSHQMIRTEIRCNQCQSHLGHVFDDGPAPTYRRYCVNSVSLTFEAS